MAHMGIEERFFSKVQILLGGCWKWRAKISTTGYGRFFIPRPRKHHVQAHRWSYENAKGPIPPGLDLDHVCRNRWCVNPEHVEPVTRRENLIRGQTAIARNVAKTHCPGGHPYDESNTYRYRGMRQCRICRDRHRENWRRKAKRTVAARPPLFLER